MNEMVITENVNGVTYTYDIEPLLDFFNHMMGVEELALKLAKLPMEYIFEAGIAKQSDIEFISEAIYPVCPLYNTLVKMIDNRKVKKEG